ncbi:MAG TPA: alpha/beta hydrolase, partial [Salinimicrobium catena]|nr:alpha/beta hydrolase [Salinimicrobium catena]
MKRIILTIMFLCALAGRAQSTASQNVTTFEIEAPQLDT